MLQFSFMHATKQVMYATGLHRSLGRVNVLQNRVAYATGLHRIGICVPQSRVAYTTEQGRVCHSSVLCMPQSRLRMPQVSTGH